MFVLGDINGFGNCSYNLTMIFKVRAVQDIIHSLMNHAPTFNHLSEPILLDHLELHLDLLALHSYCKTSATI